MKENYTVTFEMLNGDKPSYTLEDITEEAIYQMFVKPVDGYIEIVDRGEKHFISAEKIVRVKLLSDTVKKERHEKTARAVRSISF